MADNPSTEEISMDNNNLYRDESFTDRRVGSIQRLSPVTANGDADASRDVIYVGQTQIMTPSGALPLSFEIAAESLSDAVEKFGANAEQALQDTMARLEEMRREAQSSLIVPGAGGGAGPAAPGGGLQIP